jgi:hypothetical protein
MIDPKQRKCERRCEMLRKIKTAMKAPVVLGGIAPTALAWGVLAISIVAYA